MRKMRKNEPIIEKLFTNDTMLLCLCGILLNFILAKTMIYLQLPLYMDSVGSIIVGALGGKLPGIAVGFISNIINSLTEPISMYYGFITVAMAYLATIFSEKGYFKTWQGRLIILPYYVLLGGAVGSVFTWFLYGNKITGLAEPYAMILYNDYALSPFMAQLLGDILIDIPDKILTICLASSVLVHYPAWLYDRFPLSYLYDRTAKKAEQTKAAKQAHFRVRSLDARFVHLVVGATVLVSIFSVIISSVYHHNRLSESYANQVETASRSVADTINGDKIDEYLAYGRITADYAEVERKLYKIKENNKLLKYIFVYHISEQGSRVVFDLDTPDLQGQESGTLLTDEQGIKEHMAELLQGEKIAAEFTSGKYGYMMTAYTPIRNSRNQVVAYAGVDIGMESYIADMLTFIIQIISIIFALTISIAFFALWYVQREVTVPINNIMNFVKNLDQMHPEKWLTSETWLHKPTVQTGDEIETLYNTICKLEENSANYVQRIMETEQQLAASKKIEHINVKLKAAMVKADEATRVKSEFYSRMSHDMRTPMNGIIGLVNLSEGETDTEVLQQNMKKIGVSSQYLLGLINDTLDMSRMESKRLTLDREPIGLQSFLENVETMMRATFAKKQLHFACQYEDNVTNQMILGDEMRLKQVFMNLLSNAAKFTPNEGLIKLIVEQQEMTEKKVVYKFIFADNGYGMSKNFLSQSIFKPFSQERNAVTREYAGTGLGLAIVKNLVELMDGHITVDSQLGEGTTFTVTLPFTMAKAEDIAQVEAKAAKHRNVDLSILADSRVLLCEDHPLNTEIMVRLLTKMGVTVETAANGKIGVEIFRNKPLHYFAAILMDIRMPIMDGLEATKIIRHMDRADVQTIPIIAMTANAFAEDIAASHDAGMDAHLAKPINPQLMYETLAEKLGGVDGQNMR